jgi:hypothetical protein
MIHVYFKLFDLEGNFKVNPEFVHLPILDRDALALNKC